jgi:signal transduction histidine kinase
LLNPEIGGQLRDAIGKTLETGQPSVVEYEWRGSGGPHYREARIVPFEEDEVLALIRDIGERKEAERQRDLYERGEKLRALGQMAGGIAHDLNQALAVVTGYVELALDDLQRSAQTRNGGETNAFLQTASEAAAQGADAVKRLLTFARQQDQGPPESVDVGQVLQDTIRFTAPQWRDRAQAEGRPIQIEADAATGLVVFGWATALREALMNLVLNAVDALPNGGTIRLTAHRQDDAIVIEVADTGTGMPPDVQARIFEPFFTTKGEQGTGLGLAMVAGIVERHNGEVSVSSEEGRGTTFSLRLPAVSAPAAANGRDAPTTTTSPARILVVDDDVRLARMLAALLARDRHDVDTAASGEEALNRLEAGSYDLVVSDLSMGTGMNGWELAQEVARRWPGTRFVLASGWGASIEEHEARRQAVDAVMAKPYRTDEIRRTVTRLTT